MRASFLLSASILLLASCGGGDSVSIAGSASATGTGTGTGGGSGGGGGGGSGGGSGSAGGSTSGSAGGSAACMGKMSVPPGNIEATVMTSGEERSFQIHVPPGYDPQKPTTLLLGLHGYTETNDDFAALSHFAEAADARGIIVVFPQGVAPIGIPGWNAGTCCGSAASQNTPDVQFMRDMIDQLEQDFCIDPRRIFASGFSNGGMLSHRLACELSERIAAIGAVSGTMAISECAPSRPVPVLHIHGTSDPIVPYDNGLLAQNVPDTINGWVSRNGCDAATSVTYEKNTVKCERHAGCDASSDVELCTITGGAHEWPSGGTGGVGDIVATDYILDFLESHPMP